MNYNHLRKPDGWKWQPCMDESPQPPAPAPSCSPKTTTAALQCQQRLTPTRAMQDACRKVTLAVIADLIANGKLMPPSSDFFTEAKAIIDQKPADYRLLDHNDEIRESDQFDDDGEWASIAQYSWFIGNHWNTAHWQRIGSNSGTCKERATSTMLTSPHDSCRLHCIVTKPLRNS